MKIRQGFVSNSSSSSFVCSITGNVEGGYECSLSEIGMVECDKGHTLYESYNQDVKDWVADSDRNTEDNYCMPEDVCPVCNGKAKEDIMLNRIRDLLHMGISLDDLKDFAIEAKLSGKL